MSKYEKPLPELVEILDELTQNYQCTKRKMFGCPSFFVNGNMFAGVFEDTIYLRLSLEEQEDLRKQYDDISQFEPIIGRKMREYIVLTEEIWQDVKIVREVLDTAYRYASSLPPKEKKK
jgi:TfoX/Sxy family transcriptional regulator of competence genes